MKIFYSFLFAMIGSYVNAQTLIQADLPFEGLVWTSGVDTNFTDHVPAGGASQNWDFSGLQYSFVDTSGFQNAAGTPYASLFPNANLAAHKISTDEWSYFNNSSSGFYVNGYVSPVLAVVIQPQQMYAPVPFSYGDMNTNISRVVIDTVYLGYNARVHLNFHADFHADGYGALITPTATYPTTLRIRETMLETDSLMIDFLGNGNYTFFGSRESQKNYFRWYQHGETANYILGIDADSLGNFATHSDYLMQWVVLGTNEIKHADLISAYPVPASTELLIRMPAKTSYSASTVIEIFDQMGKRILAQTSQPGDLYFRIDVSGYSSGIYFYSLRSDGNPISGKFSVIH